MTVKWEEPFLGAMIICQCVQKCINIKTNILFDYFILAWARSKIFGI